MSIARRNGAVSTPRTVRSSSGTTLRGLGTSAAEQFPDAVEIVDIYHAKQHLCDVAKAIYGPGTDLADRWSRDRRAELDVGRLGAVVAELRIHVETTREARKCIHYVLRSCHSMRYPQFRQGPVHLVGRRRGRMQADRRTAKARRDTLDRRGANAITALRCCILSGRFGDSWEPRTKDAA